jgi:hypothetical protein
VFHFIYTDSLPTADGLDGSGDDSEMIQHLLIAADIYALDRLKLKCEGIFRKSLNLRLLLPLYLLLTSIVAGSSRTCASNISTPRIQLKLW